MISESPFSPFHLIDKTGPEDPNAVRDVHLVHRNEGFVPYQPGEILFPGLTASDGVLLFPQVDDR